MNGRLVVRADASPQIGTGHVMRCLALAQAWQAQGGAATFLLGSTPAAMEARLREEGFEVARLSVESGSERDAEETAAFAAAAGAVWVVIDGYHFGSRYQKTIKRAGLHLLALDDHGTLEHYYADAVLNQNIYAETLRYESRESETQLLLGLRYALLRREFWPWRGWKRPPEARARQVLVTLGGSDPDNLTLVIVRGLQAAADALEFIAVVGAANPHADILMRELAGQAGRGRLMRSVTNMPELMAWADVAISAAGSTCWELAFMQLPGLTVTLADNQRAAAAALHDLGVFVSLGEGAQVTSEQIASETQRLLRDAGARQAMIARSRNLVDGYGAARAAAFLWEQGGRDDSA